jgi:hypothetical protein
MQLGTVGSYPLTIGSLIALLVLLAVLVLWIIGQLEPRLALLIGGLALARLT